MGKILLTGAHGFTGYHFAQAAERAGYAVHALQSDITDAHAVAQEVKSAAPTYVVHLAAISAVTHADEEGFYRVNLFGTLNLLKACAALDNKPANILLVSSANVYGNAPVSPIVETVCPAPVNHYAVSKLAMEHMASTYAEQLSLTFVRPFNYTGVGHDERFVVPKLVAHFAARAAEICLGNLEVEREFNDVRVVCDAYLKLLKRGERNQVYNVCSGRPVSLEDVINILQRITGHHIAVRVNSALVRGNEVRRLYGSPEKLYRCIGPLQHPDLENTLTWMLGDN